MSLADAGAPSSSPSWTCVRALRGGHEGGAPLQVAKFSADGRYVFTGGQDRAVCLWAPHRPPLPGSAAAAAAAGAGDPTPAAPPGALLQRYAGVHAGEVVDLAVARDGSRFASAGGADRSAAVTDVATGGAVRRLPHHDGRLASVAWSDWDGAGGDAVNLLVTGGQDKAVRIWDLRSADRAPAQAMRHARDGVTRVMWEGPRGGGTGGGGGGGAGGGGAPAVARVVAASMDGSLRTYDLRNATVAVDAVGAPLATAALAASGAAFLASCFTGRGGAGALVLVDRATGAVLNAYGGHANASYRLGCALTSDDAAVASGSEDGRLCVWATLAPPGAPPGGARAHARAVAWVEAHPAPGARVLLTAGFDGVAKLWTAPPGEGEAAALPRGGGG